MRDIVSISLGEILSWSLMGGKGWKPLNTEKQWDMKNCEWNSFILILPAHSDALRSVYVALQ